MAAPVTFILGVLALLPALAAGQQRAPYSTRAGAAELSPYAMDLARRLNLPSMTDSALGVEAEIRLWDGYGLTGVTLYRFRLEDQRWRVEEYAPDAKPAPFYRALPDSADWGRRIAAAQHAGLRTLPSTPRDTSTLVVEDGRSFLLEWRFRQSRGAAGADNPEIFCSPDDQRLLQVLRALTGEHLACRLK
jgi:hypothetical protein